MPRGVTLSDTFTRTVASGWGTATSGQAWSLTGSGGSVLSSDWAVSGTGTLSVPVASGYRMSYLAAVSVADIHHSYTTIMGAAPVGAPLEFMGLATRGQSTTSYYLGRAQLETDGTTTVHIYAPSGAELGSATVPGMGYIVGTAARLDMESIGQTHRLRLYPPGSPPPQWHLEVTDDEYTGAGWVGIRAGIAAGNTTTKPYSFSVDNYAATPVNNFPADALPLTVLWAPGADLSADYLTWPWQAMTADVRASGVSVTRGRADETNQAAPAVASLDLLNDSGAYGTGPLSSNWPNVRRNTPVWILVDPSTRFFGYIYSFTPYWDSTGKHPYVKISAAGRLRQIQQGDSPLRSPLYRAVRNGAVQPVAWWPMEDGVQTAQAASGLVGGAPMMFGGATVDFGALSDLPGAASAPDLKDTTSITAPISMAATNQWQVQFWTRNGVTGSPAQRTVLRWTTTEPRNPAWDVVIDNQGGGVTVSTIDATGASISTKSALIGMDDRWHHVAIIASKVDATHVNVHLFADGVDLGSITNASGSYGIGQVTGVLLGSAVDAFNTVNGGTYGLSTLVFYTSAAYQDLYTPGIGYAGESVADRLERLCAEEGIPLVIVGAAPALMGAQGIKTLSSLFSDCETVDLGALCDGYGPGLLYIARAARESIEPTLMLDMAAGQVDDPFEPADDDQLNRNEYTVTRDGGSSATYQDKDGPLGTDAIGLYDSSLTVPVQSDAVLRDYASWLVHEGTQGGLRYPSLNLDLGAVPAIIGGWAAARLLSRIDVLNVGQTAAQHPPGTVSLLLQGYTETLTVFGWTVGANLTPYDVWRIIILAPNSAPFGEFACYLDTNGSRVSTSAAAGATAIAVRRTVTAGPLWTTNAAHYPQFFNIGGIKVKVTAMSGTSDPQTATVDGSTVTKALPAGMPVSVWNPPVPAL